MGESWRGELVRGIDDLGRWLRGRVLLDPDPADEVVPALSFVDMGNLRAAIERSATTAAHGSGPDPEVRGDERIAIAASRFTRHYSASLTAVALVGLSRGIGVDLSAERCTMVIRSNVPFCFLLDAADHAVGAPAELREFVWRKLYAEHLAPLYRRTAETAKLSAALVWTNAAEWVGLILDAATEYLDPDESAPIATECMTLLAAPALPGVAGENPLAGRLEWFPGDGNGFPEAVQTRKLCCLTYLLGDRFGRLCQNCPHLPLEDRIALIRERHGVRMGAPGGPAERRAIERGLARPSTHRAVSRRPRS